MAGLLQVDNLRRLKRIALLQRLPLAHAARLDAHHLPPPVLGGEVGEAVGLVDPGVEDDGVVEVVAHDAEPRLAAVRDDDRVAGSLDGRVHAVRLARKGHGAGLVLCLETVELVDVVGVLEAGDLHGFNVLL